MQQYSWLTLSPLKLSVHLGYLAPEREIAQTVHADIKIKLAALPAACHSDDLSDTLCYAELAASLQTYCQQRQFKLIEALTQQLYQQVKQFSPLIAALSITVHKNPPLTNLERCAFTISDWSN